LNDEQVARVPETEMFRVLTTGAVHDDGFGFALEKFRADTCWSENDSAELPVLCWRPNWIVRTMEDAHVGSTQSVHTALTRENSLLATRESGLPSAITIAVSSVPGAPMTANPPSGMSFTTASRSTSSGTVPDTTYPSGTAAVRGSCSSGAQATTADRPSRMDRLRMEFLDGADDPTWAGCAE